MRMIKTFEDFIGNYARNHEYVSETKTQVKLDPDTFEIKEPVVKRHKVVPKFEKITEDNILGC